MFKLLMRTRFHKAVNAAYVPKKQLAYVSSRSFSATATQSNSDDAEEDDRPEDQVNWKRWIYGTLYFGTLIGYFMTSGDSEEEAKPAKH
mmetsp:Transcript_20786/g.29890  ORF Transcript_20786/g.29890 Transcript_20786/m.29890 type:complete len:89 (-) Transcript_20786:118-384(-)|eukprot:CAMPEP_0185024054 /NCGR_PEP_ID=MMETSP1103-20130426/6962_1 /TAXON_ID=36769 /ORGANISM="Paraphysomonas bandaiensis, Strain Caron Lab Isolate" /LENGTH=88 /DNA_ID=CAMNT_0027556903 /DNA_START=51 /DNA_END=317 /DNA_ORIENTATION=+